MHVARNSDAVAWSPLKLEGARIFLSVFLVGTSSLMVGHCSTGAGVGILGVGARVGFSVVGAGVGFLVTGAGVGILGTRVGRRLGKRGSTSPKVGVDGVGVGLGAGFSVVPESQYSRPILLTLSSGTPSYPVVKIQPYWLFQVIRLVPSRSPSSSANASVGSLCCDWFSIGGGGATLGCV